MLLLEAVTSASERGLQESTTDHYYQISPNKKVSKPYRDKIH